MRSPIALVLIAATIAIAGCGGSGTQPTSTTSAPVTKAQFIAAADRICARGSAAVDAYQGKVNAASAAEQASDTAAHRDALASALQSAAAPAGPVLDQLRALTPPAADRAVVAQYLADVARQTGLLGQLATAVRNDDGTAATTVSQQIATGKTAFERLAQGYGFKVCGSGG